MPPYTVAFEYWKTFLQGLKPCQFPSLLDGNPSLHQGYQETIPVKLDVSNPAVQEFCSQHHITAASLFQTAWAIVVSCYAGIEDVSFGYSAEDRTSSAEGESEGLFICRAQITADHRLFDTMINMMRSFDRGLLHRGCPIAEMQKALGLEGQPLFHSGLRIQRYSELDKNVVLNHSQEAENGALMECDVLARLLLKGDGSLAVSIRTHASKFSAAQTANIAHTFGKTLFETLRVRPRSIIGDLDILSGHDHEQVKRWNMVSSMLSETCFHHHFETMAQKTPDAAAICSWDRNFTYNELDTLSAKIAKHLTGLGVVPEMFVLLCFDKSSIAIGSMLGILKAGCAFVAIDPSYPNIRIQAIQEATGASVVVADPAHCHLFEGIVEHIVALDPESADKLTLPLNMPEPQVGPNTAAYVVFTSGSTGSPKGIVVEHRALCTAALSLAGPMRVSAMSRFLQFAPYTFDVSYGDIFVALFQGGCICIPSEEERVNDLAGAIVRMNVNTACLIPSVARMFRPEDVPCLRTLLLGGEALPQDSLKVWAGKVSVAQVYGPSEATIWCTAHTDMKADSAASNIGHGLAAFLWITASTDHDRLCPIGCIGELLIEGPVLARGYLDAQQTKLSFVKNPRWADVEPGQCRRFYKTGDLARYNNDGTVSFVGRKDTRVKLHGRRIEMGEIEYHLASHRLLRQSMVILPTTGRYSQHLVAVVVLQTGELPTHRATELKTLTGAAKKSSSSAVAEVKHFLASRVPAYMLPQFWVVVEDIPTMISGKMNRVIAKNFVESLSDKSQDDGDQGASLRVDLDDPMEASLRNIWSRVLDRSVSDIGAGQSFFDLGGDSFSAMDLVAGCKAEGLALTVRDVLSTNTKPTIRQMASIIRGQPGQGSQGVTRVQEELTARKLLKFAPVWWDGLPVLLSELAQVSFMYLS